MTSRDTEEGDDVGERTPLLTGQCDNIADRHGELVDRAESADRNILLICLIVCIT